MCLRLAYASPFLAQSRRSTPVGTRSVKAQPPLLHQLPAPGPEAAAHSERLQAHILAEIAAGGGALGFGRYMELALYAPGLGYYSAGQHKLGAGGDFVTAPELSPLFAACLGRQCREVLDRLGGGEILEVGAGTGALAADLLTSLEGLGALPERYTILELSADLRERQQARLRGCSPAVANRVVWRDSWPEPGLRGIVLANEVLDAMPVERFRIGAGGSIESLQVVWCEGRFDWQAAPADAELAQRVRQLQQELGGPLPVGYSSEINLVLGAWVQGLSKVLASGLALLIDYGYPRREYYLRERTDGTLLCHYRHRAHPDPFAFIGLQDITAHVDFTAVAEAGVQAGLEVCGFTTQAHFLLGSGLDELLVASDPADMREHLERVRQAKLLTLPGEMGERFKVLGLCRGVEGPLRGFAVQDQRHRL
jgi:SAM-dependent MidA family methyltransferase